MTAGPRVRSTLRRPPAPALVLAAILSVQSGAALAKGIFTQLGPAGATVLRLIAATLVLLIVLRPSIPRTGRLVLVGYGVALGAMNLSFYAALSRIPLGVAVTVEFVGPLTVAVTGSRRARDVAAVVVAALGILLLARGGTASLDLLGVGLAAVAGACWAAYIVLSQASGRRHAGGAPVALAMVVATLFVLPFGAGAALHADRSSLLVGAAVGLLSSVIPYSLELEALRRLPARTFGVLLSLEPAAAALSGRVILGEHLAVRQWIGILFVVGASVAATRSAHTELPVA